MLHIQVTFPPMDMCGNCEQPYYNIIFSLYFTLKGEELMVMYFGLCYSILGINCFPILLTFLVAGETL